jgi:hypothetical protein
MSSNDQADQLRMSWVQTERRLEMCWTLPSEASEEPSVIPLQFAEVLEAPIVPAAA